MDLARRVIREPDIANPKQYRRRVRQLAAASTPNGPLELVQIHERGFVQQLARAGEVFARRAAEGAVEHAVKLRVAAEMGAQSGQGEATSSVDGADELDEPHAGSVLDQS